MATPIDPITLFFVSSSIIGVLLVFLVVGVFRAKLKSMPITIEQAQEIATELVLRLNGGKKYGMYKKLNELHPEFKVNTVRQLLSPNSEYPNPEKPLAHLIGTLSGKKQKVQ